MHLTKIVHPTDFSAVSNTALRFAAAIARKAGSKIMLAHVYERPYITESYVGGLRPAVNTEMDKALHESINQQIEELASSDLVKGVALSKKTFHDMPAWKIVDNLDADSGMIVMGTRGHSGILHGGLLGTNAERVIRRSEIPVLVVPENTLTDGTFSKILLATDFKSPLNVFLPFVIELAKAFDADLYLTHINTASNFGSSDFAEDQFEALKKNHPYAKLHLLVHNSEDVANAVRDLTQKKGFDLVAMLTHGRTGIGALLQSSITEELSKTLRVPLLTYKG